MSPNNPIAALEIRSGPRTRNCWTTAKRTTEQTRVSRDVCRVAACGQQVCLDIHLSVGDYVFIVASIFLHSVFLYAYGLSLRVCLCLSARLCVLVCVS